MSSPKKPLFLSILLFLLLIPTSLFGKEGESSALRHLVMEGAFVLTVEEDLVSLKARETSLKIMVEEIGWKMAAWNRQRLHPPSKTRVPEPVVAQKWLDADMPAPPSGHRGA